MCKCATCTKFSLRAVLDDSRAFSQGCRTGTTTTFVFARAQLTEKTARQLLIVAAAGAEGESNGVLCRPLFVLSSIHLPIKCAVEQKGTLSRDQHRPMVYTADPADVCVL